MRNWSLVNAVAERNFDNKSVPPLPRNRIRWYCVEAHLTKSSSVRFDGRFESSTRTCRA